MVLSLKHPGTPTHLVQNPLWCIHLGNTHTGSPSLMHVISVELGCWQINAVHEDLRCCVGTQRVLLPPKTPPVCNIIYRWGNSYTAWHPRLHTTPNVPLPPNLQLQQWAGPESLPHSARCAWQGQRHTAHIHRWILHTSSLVVSFLFWADQNSWNNINPAGQSIHQGLKEKAFWSSPNTHKNVLHCTALAHLCNRGRADTTHRAWISSFSSGLWFIFQTQNYFPDQNRQ